MVEIVLSTKLLILISVASSTLMKFTGNERREVFNLDTKPISVSSGASAQCPDTWVVFDNSCYKLITQKHNWYDAQTNCKNLGGSLVNIGSQKEDKFVVKLARNHGVTVWIGFNDMVQEGHFVWADTQQEPTYTRWLDGEPNQTVENETCVLMLYEQGGLWDADACEKEVAAVCEKNSPFKSVASAQCPDTWVAFDNSCYKLITEARDWYDARTNCKNLGGSLVNIGSQRENEFVVRLAPNYGGIWIGLNDLLQEGQFEWVDPQQDTTYTNWIYGFPDHRVENEHCVVISLGSFWGFWLNGQCWVRIASVCEMPFSAKSIASAQCPDTWVVFDNSCYKLITQKRRWYDAQTICKSVGSSLINIGSQKENKFVVGLAYNYGVTVWIGLNDVMEKGQFVWADTQQEPTYTHWLAGEPNLTGENENCVQMLYEQGGSWNTDACEKELATVCEKYSPFKSVASAQCPETWVVFDNSCYKLITQERDWYDARKNCKTIGGSLVIIRSQKEDHFVVGLASNHGPSVWIGLTDLLQKGRFDWVDDQQGPAYTTYTNWLPGQPSNGKESNEHCATLWFEKRGYWNNDECEKKFPSVCKKPSSDKIDQ